MRAHMLFVVLGVAGCGGSNAAGGDAGSCNSSNAGSWSMKFSARDGNCGAIPEQIVTVPADDATAQANAQKAGCTGTLERGADGCSVTYTKYTCPGTGNTSAQMTGKMSGSPTDKKISGALQIILFAGTTLTCSGTYDVAMTPL